MELCEVLNFSEKLLGDNLKLLQVLNTVGVILQQGYYDDEHALVTKLDNESPLSFDKKRTRWTSAIAIRQAKLPITTKRSFPELHGDKVVKLEFGRRRYKGYCDRVATYSGKYKLDKILSNQNNKISRETEPLIKEYVECVNQYNDVIQAAKKLVICTHEHYEALRRLSYNRTFARKAPYIESWI